MRIKIAIALLAAVLCCGVAQAKEWYEGGTLQKATMQEFLEADYDNALASTADLVAVTVSKPEIQKLNMDEFRKGVDTILACMITAANNSPKVKTFKVQEVALACLMRLKSDYPWMLSK